MSGFRGQSFVYLVLAMLIFFRLALKAQEPASVTYDAPVSRSQGEPPRPSDARLYVNLVTQNQETFLSLSPL